MFMHCDTNSNNVHLIDRYIKEGKDAFILVYMEGCGPCNATRPEWDKIKSHPAFQNKNKNNYNNIIIADVDKNVSPSLKYIGDIDGFPTMKYISNKGQMVEPYEQSNISKKDRSLDSFIEWIEKKTNKTNNNGNMAATSPHHLVRRLETVYPQQFLRYQMKPRNNKTIRSKKTTRSKKTKRSSKKTKRSNKKKRYSKTRRNKNKNKIK